MVVPKSENNLIYVKDLASSSSGGTYINQQHSIQIRLEDRDLWMRFFGKTNEMIVTRSGRYTKKKKQTNKPQ